MARKKQSFFERSENSVLQSKLKIFSALLIMLLFAAPLVHSQAAANFTLNFPQANGTTTYITVQSENDKNTQNFIGAGIVAMLAFFCLIVVLKVYKDRAG